MLYEVIYKKDIGHGVCTANFFYVGGSVEKVRQDVAAWRRVESVMNNVAIVIVSVKKVKK